MKKLILTLLSTLAVAIPLRADRGRDQSYFTYDDGGTIVRQAEDGREIDAQVNLPVYPGDEIITNRRGRAEIRLADGNIIALDRSTDIRLRSINDAYDSDSGETIVEVRYGHVAVQRTDFHTEALRLDTASASYAATDEAIYSVDSDIRVPDRVKVFYGEIEVRTPTRTSTIHEGEEGNVDESGLYGLVRSDQGNADEFERWFNRRSQRYTRDSSQYLDSSLAYAESDLAQYGSWTFVTSLGTWGWRPYVGIGWRPYYYGSWLYGPNGCLTWFTSEPWGWVPYHYGRWAYDPLFGWVWVPGYTYSPAWVYFAYGPGYFGWVPAGWYDCYRPYYGWAYQPYRRARLDFGFGFYGRVHLNEVDLRPWTFINSNQIVSARVDQAALTTDAIRQRLTRDPSAGMATVSGTPARFNRNEIRDPAAAIGAIARRGIGGSTGTGSSGSAADLTPFFRRDPELSSRVRERIVRSAPTVPPSAIGTVSGSPPRTLPTPSGVPSPGTPGTIEGRVPARGDKPADEGGVINRGTVPRGEAPRGEAPRAVNPPQPAPPPSNNERGTTGNWRDRVVRPSTPPPTTTTPPPSSNFDRGTWRERVERPITPSTPDRGTTVSPDDSWRGRIPRRDVTPRNDAPPPPTVNRTPVDRGSDIPRRIIDRIGGARIYSEPAPRSVEPRPVERSSPPPPSSERSSSPPPREHSSAPPPSRSNEGGHVNRNH